MKRRVLSVVLATYNEESNMAECLESVKNLADEIIIVDGSSTDRTVEIAGKYDAKVKITTNKPNFHINKQMAIDMATSDWILQLDADERLSPELQNEIGEKIQDSKLDIRNSVNGYWLPRKNFFLGRFLMKGGQYPDYSLRLYRRGKGRLPQKDVHEQTVVEGKIGYLKGNLLHFPYKNFSHYLSKWSKYNTFFSVQIRDNQKDKNIFQKFLCGLGFLFLKPAHWFLTTFIRHKGFMDLCPGFVFSLFSALRFPVSYLKYVGLYKFWTVIIILLALIIRFFDFSNRWSLDPDGARDALTALAAIKLHSIPMMGFFSSAGPFVIGPTHYWFIMASYLTLPSFMNSPWIFSGIISVLTVFLLMRIGKILSGDLFSLIVGLLAATSPQLVARALVLSNINFVVTCCAFLILFYLMFLENKKKIFAFLSGVSLGLAISFHYQALNLLIFLPVIFIIPKLNLKNKIYSLILMASGVVTASLPLLYWDSRQSFANIRNVMDYFLIAQYRIYVPNSWKLFILKDLPSFWSYMVGNYAIVGFILFILSAIFFVIAFFRRKTSFNFTLVGVIFYALLVVNRYYNGQRSEGYLLYLLPFLLIITSLIFYQLIVSKNIIIKAFGVLLMAFVLMVNLMEVANTLKIDNQLVKLKQFSRILSQKFPDRKFAIYDYKYMGVGTSLPLGLVMDFENKLDINGFPVGVVCDGCNPESRLTQLIDPNLPILNLSKIPPVQLNENGKTWVRVNKEDLFKYQIGWLNKYQLKSSFSLSDYLIEKLNLK